MQVGKGAGRGNCHGHGKNTEVLGADKATGHGNCFDGTKDAPAGRGFGWGFRRDAREGSDAAAENAKANKSADDNRDKPTDA
jgi:hypothetical protein